MLVVLLDGEIESLLFGLDGFGGMAHLVVCPSQHVEAPPIFAFTQLHGLLKRGTAAGEVSTHAQDVFQD